MKQTNSFLFSIFGLIFLAGCGSSSTNTSTQTSSVSSFSSSSYQSLTVSGANSKNLNLDGVVINNNIKNLTTTKAGILSSLSCNPGTKVNPGDVIGVISVDQSDPSLQNAAIQKKYLASQISNLQSMKNSAINSTNLQIQLLNSQKGSTQGQIDIMKKSIENLQTQKATTSGDLNVQISTLEDQKALLSGQAAKLQQQIEILQKSKDNLSGSKQKDLEKIDTNIQNSKSQIQNLISDSTEKVDNIFGITPLNENKNNTYENYLSAKDPSLKNGLDTQLYSIKSQLSGFSSLSNDQISSLLGQTADFLKQADNSVNASIASTQFPQSQIDGYYSLLFQQMNSVLSAKTNFDTAFLSTTTTDNTYQNQINQIDTNISTLESNYQALQNNIIATQKNIDDIKANKGVSADVQIDNSINNIQSQILSTQTSLNNLQTQIDSANQNKNLQANQYDNQILGLQQNLQTIDTSFVGETIKAGISGTIKVKKADQGNKYPSGTLICQISPNSAATYKIQISSPDNIPLGTQFSTTIFDKIYTGSIGFQLPYKDTTTQMYVYYADISDGYAVKEGDKLNIQLKLSNSSPAIWLPIEYIFPKLDGNYVKLVSGTGNIETKISIGNTDGNLVQVLSGIKIGDKLIK